MVNLTATRIERVGSEQEGTLVDLNQLRRLYLGRKPEMGNIDDDGYYSYSGKDKVFIPVKQLPMDEQLRILVTGGAGFVGSHLVDRLMIMGHQVTVLDNFFTGSKNNISNWIGHPNFTLVVHDVVDPFLCEVDQIYHLACPASPPHYQANPIKTIKTGFLGTYNMLGLAKRVNARFLLASTSEIYGDPIEHPQQESYWGNVNPIGPRSCYDESKRIGETLTREYAALGVETRIVRIFNTFGPRMNPADGRVVSNFILQALKGQPLAIYGDGQQTRSFQYVHDLVDGLILTMGGNYSGPINLGNPHEFTIKDFAEQVAELVGDGSKKVNVVHLDAVVDDPKKRKPDISTAKAQIGWEPQFSVQQGVKETTEYFRGLIEAGLC